MRFICLPSSASIPFNLLAGGTPFVNYHVSASAGGALVSLEYLIHLFLYVRLLYILFFSVYYWTIVSFHSPRLLRLFREATLLVL